MTVNSLFPITRHYQVAEDTYCLRFRSPELAAEIKPGQFFNVRVEESYDPILRRPYSISNVIGDEIEMMFAVVGKGTNILKSKKEGDTIGVVGPLGNTFGYDKDFSDAIILAGGIGVAPFPYLTRYLIERGKNILTIVGARNAGRVVRQGLEHIVVATDDGSEGFHGNVVQCLQQELNVRQPAKPMIFACGPNAMLKAVQEFANTSEIPCELSLESEMACGMGICQGCPVEHKHAPRKYALVCTDGPCFDSRIIVFNEH